MKGLVRSELEFRTWNGDPRMAWSKEPGVHDGELPHAEYRRQSEFHSHESYYRHACRRTRSLPPRRLSIDKVLERWMVSFDCRPRARTIDLIDVKDLEPYADQMGKVAMFFVRTGNDRH